MGSYRKSPYLPKGRLRENPRGGGGVQKHNLCCMMLNWNFWRGTKKTSVGE